MEDFAKKYLDWYQGLSKGVRAILCLLWDIPSNLYRFSKSALKNNSLGIIVAVLLAIFGGWVLFVVDLCCILLTDKVLWLDDLGYQETAKPKDERAEDPEQEEASAEAKEEANNKEKNE